MKNTYRKIYWSVAIVWGVVACFFALLYAFFYKDEMALNPTGSAALSWNIAYWSMVTLFALVIVLTIGFALGQIIKYPKKQKKTIFAVIILAVVFVVCYILASGTDIPQLLFDKTGSDYGNSKLIGGSLYMVYTLLAGVVIAVLYAEIAKKIK
ncbi:MAG: hypothetical protein LBR17_03670 [Bacteroidales bacterium]|jgi:uncharacterized membrane protein|nr:hypothetical protein [Bacteroidales bacterium]